MKVIPCTLPVFCDVDDTLIMFNPPPEGYEGKYETIFVNNESLSKQAWINHDNVQAIRNHKVRGHTVIVWSAGGWAWAEQVVHLLGLQDVVDVVIEKPRWAIDDLPSAYILPDVYWKGPKEWKTR